MATKFKPGMKIQNVVSKNKGIVLADPMDPKKLMDCHPDYIWIKRHGAVGRGRQNAWISRVWARANCRAVR